MSLVPYQAPATLDQVMRLVLDAVSSPSTRTMYGKALADFFALVERAGKSALLPRRGPGAPRRTGEQGIRSVDHQPAPGGD